MKVKCYLVGSGARRLITQNGKEPVDLDYNIVIIGNKNDYDARECKEMIREGLNRVLKKYGLPDSHDSTSCLTTDGIGPTGGNNTPFSLDIAILKKTGKQGHLSRLIHFKTGNVGNDTYTWNEVPNTNGLEEKVKALREYGYWSEVRQAYLNLKNMYLNKRDHNHPSYICYMEAVNQVFHKNLK